MAKKVAKVGIKKEKGYLYFLDKKGNVAKVQMKRAGKNTRTGLKSRQTRWQRNLATLVSSRTTSRYVRLSNKLSRNT